MRKLAKSLIVVLPAFLAGVVGWIFIPFQPVRSVSVSAGTKLLEFSPAGKYVVTFQGDKRRLKFWRTDTGQATYETETLYLVASNGSTNGARAFYSFSADDRWLAVATVRPFRLVIVDLASGNMETPIAQLPIDPDRYRPRPAFSSDGRYLCYFSEDGGGEDCAVLHDLVERKKRLQVPEVFDSLGPPTRLGKWLLVNRANGIEIWDVIQKRREDILPLWPFRWSMISRSLTPDEQAVTTLCFVCRPFPKEGILLYRSDLTTQNIEPAWNYPLPSPARLFWNMASSDPNEFLLIKTLDDDGVLVQDLFDVNSGKVLARYAPPIDMLENISLSHSGQIEHHGAGLIHSLGRTGEMGIDSERRVIVSKYISRDSSHFWKYFGTPLGWLGIKPGPPRLCLQFHSAETGRLLDRIPLQSSDFSRWGEPTLALHPFQPLLAVIDEHGSETRLQFWRVPPPRPWELIVACGLAAAGFVLLVWLGFSKFRKKKSEAISHAKVG